ncbi:hypothetical protein KY332_03925 [Candidatus Woesearchaeota archaeon]|nr:hypothetical protein [Candidatus Woesearchaeota archaeon]
MLKDLTEEELERRKEIKEYFKQNPITASILSAKHDKPYSGKVHYDFFKDKIFLSMENTVSKDSIDAELAGTTIGVDYVKVGNTGQGILSQLEENKQRADFVYDGKISTKNADAKDLITLIGDYDSFPPFTDTIKSIIYEEGYPAQLMYRSDKGGFVLTVTDPESKGSYTVEGMDETTSYEVLRKLKEDKKAADYVFGIIQGQSVRSDEIYTAIQAFNDDREKQRKTQRSKTGIINLEDAWKKQDDSTLEKKVEENPALEPIEEESQYPIIIVEDDSEEDDFEGDIAEHITRELHEMERGE